MQSKCGSTRVRLSTRAIASASRSACTWPGLGVGLGIRAELGLGLRLGLERLVHTLEPDRVLERRTHEGDAR